MARLIKRGKTYYLGYYVPGERDERRESLHTQDAKEAKRMLKERVTAGTHTRRLAAPVVAHGRGIGELLDTLETEYKMQGRKSLEALRTRFKPLKEYFGASPACELRTEHLRQYVLLRQGEGKANATINRELSALRRAYTLAAESDYELRVPKFPMLRENNVRQGTYTREEIDRLVECLPAHVKPVVRFAYLTGRRRGEILQLKWSDVNWRERYIAVRQETTKTGDPDHIPMEGELLDLMAKLHAAKTLKYENISWVFHYRGKPFTKFYKSWHQALDKAGLPDRLFHDIRRTVSTDLDEAGVPRQVAMRITGHKTESTYLRYRIVKDTSIREAQAKLADYRRGK
jgi:integrase